jgi:hypothetical protein
MGFAGPALAGWVIAHFSPSESDVHGLAIAFGIDALLTLGAVITISLMTNLKATASRNDGGLEPTFMVSIKQGIVHAWLHEDTRAILLMLAAINLFIMTPVFLGLPVLAATRLTGGSETLGFLSSCFAGGALLGTMLAGALSKPERSRKGSIFIAVFGLCIASVGLLFITGSRLLAALSVFTMGTLVSYFNVVATTWLQRCTPPHLLGRMMGLLALK